ncbi:MAG: metallophosphoesterase [Thiohalomonadaceae bacterium]
MGAAKLVAIGDVHGSYDKLTRLLKKLPSDADIIFLGDYIDRGDKSYEVLELLMDSDYTLLRGNHDVMPFENKGMWFLNGGVATADSLSAHGKHIYDYKEFFTYRLEDYRVVETPVQTYYFSHAGFSVDRALADSVLDEDTLMWQRIVNVIDLSFVKKNWTDGTAVIGHTPLDRPYVSRELLAIDTAAFMKGRPLTAVILPTEEGQTVEFVQES